jgi:hypothetical protein
MGETHLELLDMIRTKPSDIHDSYARQFQAMHQALPALGHDIAICTLFTPNTVQIFEICDLPTDPEALEHFEPEPGWLVGLVEKLIGPDFIARGFAISNQVLATWHSHTVLVTADGLAAEYAIVGPVQVPLFSETMQQDAVQCGKRLWGTWWEARCICGNPFGHECVDHDHDHDHESEE